MRERTIIKNVAIASIIITVSFMAGAVLKTAQAEYSCPQGSYPIGDGICKQEPTGCPYGDSIPLDSPKCAPQTTEEKQAVKKKTNKTTTPPATVNKGVCGK